MNKLIIFFCCLFFSVNEKTQKTDSLPTTKNMIHKVDSIVADPVSDDQIYNAKVLKDFFEKLKENESYNNQKINIVHVGDSHIQGDLMTNEVRKKLQQQFGNAGRGLVFPYQLAKTNGSYNERFYSNRAWESYRNILPTKNAPIGLSGIGLWRDNGGFAVELRVKDLAYKFNTIKIITPQNQPMFDLATSSQINLIRSSEKKVITHKIKKGEAISTIADKYNISVAEIKKANGLKSNNIRAGRTLKIPTNETKEKTIKSSEFVPLNLESDSFCHYYNSDKALEKIYLVPNKEASKYELNGIVLEKDAPGILYSGIGVNGAKYSDYNKYPLFFEQLKAVHPDLLVFSLGTNESYDHLEVEGYIKHLREFISNIKSQNINVPIIVMTPPPSLLRRKPNTYIRDYAKEILEIAQKDGFAVWDLYDEFGGMDGIRKLKTQKLIGPDWVHYSKKGYEKQGDLFAQAVLKAYDNFKSKN
ncbi:LysM peptidoglycan-binding domain-containing protein [Flavobacterium zhairuonense]|uniref:GDSL-type esterase/lipase family protein n=1 Tax=Flavobacterium zhairuonense TaxID=2493631 RepID=UPI00104672EB|nr:GDSL-type esterase/lipase family protein [Flavobacterium zhairuonense]KAF2510866.1 LysM peptidoglycan-binding domain-containing protein [Flavobacterium zhairuonense]